MSEDEVQRGVIYPSISSIRDIMMQVAVMVVKEAIKEDLAEGYPGMDAWDLQKLSSEVIRLFCIVYLLNLRRPSPLLSCE
ncbi:hypothetical protein MLD38_037437 [Melastoma candidum]|uniref:Uncharacterized protein n=1 Tax=Melastoma candidum TaxID=119954 RepID=A0ACB9LPH2_9MYRT|nr:hypothetical protein MLD38_037437 [Melastoma candidum]